MSYNQNIKFNTFSSFFVSVIIYLLCLSIVFFQISSKQYVSKSYTDDLAAVINVVGVLDDTQEQNIVEEKPIVQKEIEVEKDIQTKEEEIKTTNKNLELQEATKTSENLKPQPINSSEKQETVSIDDSFSFDITDKIDEENKKEQDKIQANQKSSSKNKTSQIKSSSQTTKKAIRTGEYNEFMGKVQKILERIWNRYHIIDEGIFAIVEIKIDANGAAKVEILENSSNRLFNASVRDFVASVEAFEFPKPGLVNFVEQYRLSHRIENSQ